MSVGSRNICFVVDDDRDDQEIFCLATQTVAPRVECIFAGDGEEALQKFIQDPAFLPDEMFIDMNMPRMNGLRCLEEIRKIRRLDGMPVFMYSTSAEPAIVEETKRLGAAEYIVKPPSMDVLVEILKPIFQAA